jgi:dienelactone hydrolase
LKWPWIWIDRYALYDLHKEKSATSLFSDLEEIDLNTVGLTDGQDSFTTTFHDTRDGKRYGTYESAVTWPSKFVEHDQMTGDFVLPAAESKDTLIAIHGWRMDGLDRIRGVFEDVCRDQSVNLYMPHLPFHLKRKPETSSYSGELLVSADVSQTILALNQAIAEIKQLIDYVRKTHGGRVMLAGISFGGYIANLVATKHEVDGLFSVFFPDNLAHSIWNTIPGKFIKADLDTNGYTFEKLNHAWASVHPSSFTPKLSPDRIVLVQGLYDQYIDFEDASVLWEKWGHPKRVVMKAGHAAIVLKRKQLANHAHDFIRQIRSLG